MTSKNFEMCYCLKDSPRANKDLLGMITTKEDRDELYKECLATPQGSLLAITYFQTMKATLQEAFANADASGTEVYGGFLLVLRNHSGSPHCATRFSLSAHVATEPWLQISSRIRQHRTYIV
ncbi:uncharacterized protein G2W53_022329 [Senna tora]|uniref:Uncharacterized protein n=1 Tax=Senna tora TaxID=362788 RepID=A0A834TPH8_9FABA|nr:uncharacterized protein G2W53_022329 [Senna tora]